MNLNIGKLAAGGYYVSVVYDNGEGRVRHVVPDFFTLISKATALIKQWAVEEQRTNHDYR